MEADTLERLGPFRLLEELGTGAMGTVYRAEDTDEDRTVALKVLHPHLLSRKGFFQRFQREALAGQQVKHPNVVRTLDCSFHVTSDQPYCVLVMEYVRGRTLRELLHDLGTVPESLVREIGRQVAEGLAAIHDAGLVHRDLKPENVLITEDHRVRIMDLGVARHTEQSTALTQEGQFAGSLLYAAPEQFRGGSEVSPAADLYALGVVLYELISGVNPFSHNEPGQVLHAHLDLVPERLERRTEEASSFLSELVATLLAKDVESRFESSTSLNQVLAEGESSAWWRARERALLEGRERRVRVPVRRDTELYGREGDLALLEHAWGRAAEGNGNSVLLEGEAGIGKSRLVDAFLAKVNGAATHVLYGSYPPSGGMGGISDALLECLGRADLDEALRPYLTITPTLVPALSAMLKQEVPPEGTPALQGDALHAACVHLMRGMAEERPLIWVVEDLQFADADSRKLILSLARAVAGHPVLLCLTTRPGLPEDELAHFGRLENLQRTSLARLGAREVIALLQDAFRSQALAEKLGGKIAFKSDGVPFFVFEMIRGLREGQFITQLPDGSWIDSKVIDDIEVPSRIRDLIEVRLKGLSREERAILDVGAVLGFAFDPTLVADALELPSVSVLQDLADMERRSGVVRGSGADYRFDHHQMQEVIYGALHDRLCAEYHTVVADALADRQAAQGREAEDMPGEMKVVFATHHLHGNRPASALPFLDHALRQLADTHRDEEWVGLAGLALGRPDLLHGAARVRMLGSLGGSSGPLERMGRGERQVIVCEEACDVAREIGAQELTVRALLGVAAGHLACGRLDEAQGRLEHVRDLARDLGDSGTEASATQGLANLYAMQSRAADAEVESQRALALSLQVGDRDGEGYAELGVGNSLSLSGQHDRAYGHHERALVIFRETGYRRGAAQSSLNLGGACYQRGLTTEAQEHVERSLALAQEIGDRPLEAMAHGNLGSLFHLLGLHGKARSHKERSLALFHEVGNVLLELNGMISLGNLCRSENRVAEGLDYLERALALAREINDRGLEALALLNLGTTYGSLGLASRAVEALSAARDAYRNLGRRQEECCALAYLVTVGSEEEDVRDALRLARETLARLREIEDGLVTPGLLVNLGDLHRRIGKPQAAREALEEAATLYGDQGQAAGLASAMAILARLPGGDVQAALAALEKAGEDYGVRYHLWAATGDLTHLREAKRLLDDLVEHAPEEYRESMLKNVRLHREIMDAWAEHGGGEPEEAPEDA